MLKADIRRRSIPLALVGVLLATGIIAGVSVLSEEGVLPFGTSGGSSSILGPTGTLVAQITDPPNVPAGVSDVYVSYSDIQVQLAGDNSGTSGWYTIANAGQVDLMSVMSVRMTLGSSAVNTGVFNLVRFNIVSATVTYNGKNYTAFVPNNQITVPIGDGGVEVQTHADAAFLIDVSPTVVPYQNGTQVSWILVPAAKGLPIPQQNLHRDDDKVGTKDNLSGDSWWTHEQDGTRGNLTIESAFLSSSAFQVVVKNTGTTNVTLTAISVLTNASVPAPLVTQESDNTTATSSGDYHDSETVASSASTTGSMLDGTFSSESTVTESGATTTAITGNSETHVESDYSISASATQISPTASSDSSGDIEYEHVTITEFQVLSNGSLTQPHDGVELDSAHLTVGLVIMPGQSVSLSYSEQIVTFQSSEYHSVSTSIVPGQLYYIAALGEFDTRAYANVTAGA